LGQGRGPTPAALDSGPVAVVWTEYKDPHSLDIAYRFWNGDWGPAGLVNQPDGPDDSDFVADAASHGALGPVVAWMHGNYTSGYRDIAAAAWTGVGWTPEETVCSPDSVAYAEDEYPAVALGADGVAWVAWRRRGPWPEQQDYDIWYARGQVYSPTVLIEEDPPAPSAPVVCLRVNPNPAPGPVAITCAIGGGHAIYELLIADPAGRLLDRLPIDRGAKAQTFRWPTSASDRPAPGVYFVTLHAKGAPRPSTTFKFTIIR